MTRRVKTPAAENRRSPGVTGLERHSIAPRLPAHRGSTARRSRRRNRTAARPRVRGSTGPHHRDRPHITDRDDNETAVPLQSLKALPVRKRGSTGRRPRLPLATRTMPRTWDHPAMSDKMAKATGDYPAGAGINCGLPPQDGGSRRIPHQWGNRPHPSHAA